MRRVTRSRRAGFTLLELMIVVSIIGLISTMAIPRYLFFQLKARSAEGKINLAAIQAAEVAYLSEFGHYVSAVETPAGSVSSQQLLWPADSGGFDSLGWRPDGAVYFQYAVASDSQDGFTASAIADLDNSSGRQAWAVMRPNGVGARVPAVHSDCDVSEMSSAGQIGPCDALGLGIFGSSEF
jgi:prepilin-type N-terminal cleavage/methylation domain-containing protein